jgi:hypothetical protein
MVDEDPLPSGGVGFVCVHGPAMRIPHIREHREACAPWNRTRERLHPRVEEIYLKRLRSCSARDGCDHVPLL